MRGASHNARIGGIVFDVEDLVPFGVEGGEPARLVGIFHPAGSELTSARPGKSKIDAFGIDSRAGREVRVLDPVLLAA